MIRILHIVTYMGRGGLETMLMNYYRHIDRDKIQFDFLVHRDFEADYDEEILSLGGRIYHVSRLIPWSRSYKNELKNFFREHPEYKIIHVHQDCLSSVALECAKKCGVPVRIAHSHTTSQDKNLKYIIKKHYIKKIPAFATDLFACSKAAGEWMFKDGQFMILNNAIDAGLYAENEQAAKKVREEFGLKDEILIGHIGRFSPQKNHFFLLEIFAECVKKNSNSKLMLVGDGPLKEVVKKKAAELGISSSIIFTGVRSDVPGLFQAMDVFLFPSNYEGLGIVIVEAQASGIQCVISDVIPKEAVITDGLITAESLNAPASEWAQTVLEKAAIPHEDHLAEIKAAGYDVKDAAGRLQSFYLQKAETCRKRQV